MKHKIIPSLVIPTLLFSTGALGYFAINFKWNFELISYVIFLFALIYIMFLEIVIPFKKEWQPKKIAIWSDIKHFIFSVAIFDALGKMFAVSLVIFIQKNFFSTFDFWNYIPFGLTFIIANLIGEFLPYLYHRVSHIGSSNSFFSLFLWKIHSIHHLPESLNWLKTNWVHPINMFLNTILKLIPILLLGFSEEIVFLVSITHIVISYISHANIKTPKSIWDYIIITPRVHQFHHSIKLEEAKNFSNIFPFWDMIFGTYYNRKGNVDVVGVYTSKSIEYPDDKDYLKQLIFPISTLKSCCK